MLDFVACSPHDNKDGSESFTTLVSGVTLFPEAFFFLTKVLKVGITQSRGPTLPIEFVLIYSLCRLGTQGSVLQVLCQETLPHMFVSCTWLYFADILLSLVFLSFSS